MTANDSSPILIYGATGNYGSKVVEKLLLKGEPVRVVSRNKEKARQLLGEKVEILEGDVTLKTTIVTSVKDVRAIVLCLSAIHPKLFRKMKAIERDAIITIMEEAKKAGVSRLIYMSGYEMREDLLKKLGIMDFGEIKLEIESRIKQSEFNWTILGDAPMFELFFAFYRNCKMAVPGGGKRKIPTISAEDVGEITAQAAIRDDLGGLRLRMTGPQAFSFPEMAKKLSDFTGNEVKHITIPLGVVNVGTFLIKPFFPYGRYLYKSLKMLNNFPEDLAEQVPQDHRRLRDLFDYEPVTMEEEIKRKLKTDNRE